MNELETDPPTTPNPIEPVHEPVTEPVEPTPAVSRRQHRRGAATGVIAGVLLVAVLGLIIGEISLFEAQDRLAGDIRSIPDQQSHVDQLASQVASLDQKIAALAARKPPAPPTPQVTVETRIPPELGDKIAALQQSIASLSTTAIADHAAVAGLQDHAVKLPKLIARAQATELLTLASIALQNGDPLGAIPNAPPALSRYATAKPPTIGALQASFPGYADKADAAGGDVGGSGGFWSKLQDRVQNLVTIRHGSKVLVGSRAAGQLGAAQADLDRDDLAAAVAAIKTLPAPAQSAMAPWTEQASDLLAARAAIATMAGQS